MKTFYLDLNVSGVKLSEGETPLSICSNWVNGLIVLAERERHGQKGCPTDILKFIAKIKEVFDSSAEKGLDQVELQDDQYQFVRRCLRDTRVDPQHAVIVSRVLDCLERSEDFNRPVEKPARET